MEERETLLNVCILLDPSASGRALKMKVWLGQGISRTRDTLQDDQMRWPVYMPVYMYVESVHTRANYHYLVRYWNGWNGCVSREAMSILYHRTENPVRLWGLTRT